MLIENVNRIIALGGGWEGGMTGIREIEKCFRLFFCNMLFITLLAGYEILIM